MEQVDTKEIEQSKTPESLYSAIEKCSAEPEDLSRENAYREARNALIRFRKVYIKLPDFPDRKENAIEGLQEVMDWCIRAIHIVDHMVDDMDKNVIEGFICKLNELKGLPASGFPKTDKDIWQKAEDRAEKIVDKYQAGKKPPKGLNLYTFSSSRTKFSGVVSIISSLKDVADRKAGRPNRWPKMFAHDPIMSSPLIEQEIEASEKAYTKIRFYKAVEKIYRLMDSNYTTALAKLEDGIFIVFEKWNKLNDTDTSKLLDKYDELKGLKFQDCTDRLVSVYSIDSIVDTAFGLDLDLALGGETREALVDRMIETLHNIGSKTKEKTQMKPSKNDEKHSGDTYNINGDYVGQDKVGGDKAGRDISKTIVKPDSSSASPGAIEPKPPKLFEYIEWFRLHGLKHWKLILIALIFLGFILTAKYYFAQLGKGKKIAVIEKGHISGKQSAKSNEKQHLSAPQIKFSDGTMATVEFTVQIHLINPDLLIQAHSLYGSAEKASESLMNSLKGVLIAFLETKTQDYVRKNRRVVASEIIEQTKDAQQRTAYRIVELSIGEIH